MNYLTVASPLGELTIFADVFDGGGAIVALEFGCAPEPAGSPGVLLRRVARQLTDYFAGRRKVFDLPLRPAGTPFQRRVWAALSAIPYGATLTYGALARKLRSAPRAVGGACGANPIPIMIPCHRVLGADRRLGGYSGEGGPTTKRHLLALEGVFP
jgi:methylated-DNA-[protein]-cysteine S-methyltransferase